MAIERIEITGRVRKPAALKADRSWWFKNDDEQNLEEARWYMPDAPQAVREFFWNARNPVQNFRAYVIGVQDLNFSVIGRAPVRTIQRDDLVPPEYGWQWCVLFGGDLWPFMLPFVSYVGRRIIFQAGWQWMGFATLKLNRGKDLSK